MSAVEATRLEEVGLGTSVPRLRYPRGHPVRALPRQGRRIPDTQGEGLSRGLGERTHSHISVKNKAGVRASPCVPPGDAGTVWLGERPWRTEQPSRDFSIHGGDRMRAPVTGGVRRGPREPLSQG